MRLFIVFVGLFLILKGESVCNRLSTFTMSDVNIVSFETLSKFSVPKTKMDSLFAILESPEIGMRNVKVVVAQSILETGNFTSEIFKKNHNAFGMKMNKRGYAKRKERGHAYYDYVYDSFKDYAAWQKMCLSYYDHPLTDEEYLNMLDKLPFKKRARYAEDLEYTNKLRYIIKNKILPCCSVEARR